MRKVSRRRAARAAILGAGLAAVLALSLAGCRQSEGHTPPHAVAPAPIPAAPLVQTTPIQSEQPRMSTQLPATLEPYQDVVLAARVPGFVSRLYADRGTRIRAGQVLARIEAPDLDAKVAEARHQLSSARARLAGAQAALARDQATLARLQGAAAAMAGAVAGNDITVAEQTVKVDQADVASRQSAIEAAEQALRSLQALQKYLEVRAPFNGMVVKLMVGDGALVGPGGSPLFQVQQLDPLRLVVDVPEDQVTGAAPGNHVNFTVSAFPDQTFSGVVARVSHSERPETRTMPVEADVANPKLTLAPGMFARVSWPVERTHPTLFVPEKAVIDSTTGMLVDVVRRGHIDRVAVKVGYSHDGQVEIFGPVRAGEPVVVPGDETLPQGAAVRVGS